MAEVFVQVGENEIVAAITRGSAERMDLKVDDIITVITKAAKVMVEKE